MAQLVVAIARYYLYEFDGPDAGPTSPRWRWEWYRLAMQVAYDEHDLVRFSGNVCDGHCRQCEPKPPRFG